MIIINIDMPYNVYAVMIKWCCEKLPLNNDDRTWWLDTKYELNQKNHKYGMVGKIYFKSENDALLFILTWI
jgi:hypothetical protein